MTTATPATDYFAVYDGGTFKANVQARDAKHAKAIARDHGIRLSRKASAARIGREGYFAALRRAFPQT